MDYGISWIWRSCTRWWNSMGRLMILLRIWLRWRWRMDLMIISLCWFWSWIDMWLFVLFILQLSSYLYTNTLLKQYQYSWLILSKGNTKIEHIWSFNHSIIQSLDHLVIFHLHSPIIISKRILLFFLLKLTTVGNILLVLLVHHLPYRSRVSHNLILSYAQGFSEDGWVFLQVDGQAVIA